MDKRSDQRWRSHPTARKLHGRTRRMQQRGSRQVRSRPQASTGSREFCRILVSRRSDMILPKGTRILVDHLSKPNLRARAVEWSNPVWKPPESPRTSEVVKSTGFMGILLALKSLRTLSAEKLVRLRTATATVHVLFTAGWSRGYLQVVGMSHAQPRLRRSRRRHQRGKGGSALGMLWQHPFVSAPAGA
jgi:hypothetical protein